MNHKTFHCPICSHLFHVTGSLSAHRVESKSPQELSKNLRGALWQSSNGLSRSRGPARSSNIVSVTNQSEFVSDSRKVNMSEQCQNFKVWSPWKSRMWYHFRCAIPPKRYQRKRQIPEKRKTLASPTRLGLQNVFEGEARRADSDVGTP